MRTQMAVRGAAELTIGRQRSPQHEFGPHMVRYLRAANVKDGSLELDDVKSMNFTPAEQNVFALKYGDVLVTEGSGSLGAVGASAVWREELSGTVCFQNTLLRMRPRSGVDGRFLGWWARSAFANGEFASIASGANIYHLSAERVRSLPISVPSLDEQRRIADFLDAETAHADQLINFRQRQFDLMNDLIVQFISEAFRSGSSATEVRLGYLAKVQTGVTVDGGREGAELQPYPYLRVANVQAGYLNLADVAEIRVHRKVAAASMLSPGDVLMTEGGDLDKLGRGTVWHGEIAQCLHQNHVFAVRPNTALLIPEYLALYTSSHAARQYFESTGTKTTNLASTSSSKIRDFHVPVRTLVQQQSLVAQISTQSKAVERLKAELATQLALLTERRQALITAAVTGQVDVTTARGVAVP